jgi:hypothetical protein
MPILSRDIFDLPVECIPEMQPEANMIRMEVLIARSLDVKYGLGTAERNTKQGHNSICPVDNAGNAASGLVHVDVVLQEVVVLDSHGIAGPEEKWKPLTDLVQLRLQSFREA